MRRILIIEDVQSLREEILEILYCLDFEGIGAENGAVGVQLAQMHLPDLIISDIMMPEMNGYDVFRVLRQDPETATIPFVFLSAKADKSDIREGMNLGADDYLTKPFTVAELKEAIAARLEKQAALAQPYMTEMKRAAEQLSQQTYHDPLTNLSNRIRLHHQLRQALIQARQDQRLLVILCLNLDRFKSINATLGYSTGDALLQLIAERLKQCVEPGDAIARLGGDEFGVVLTNIISVQAAAAAAQKILNILSETCEINGHLIRVRLSIGATVYPEDNSDADKLLNHADMAMHRIKQQGGNSYQFYRREMETLAAQQQLLKADLEKAVERAELQLYYQPQVNFVTGCIIGTEALLRWRHPKLGMVSPAIFIPIAEATGLIVPIGEWVLRTACAQAKVWQTFNPLPPRISVNLSARQFRQQNLVETITQILQESGLDPSCIGIELTESSVMEDVESTVGTLCALKEMGIQIAIDDFGTGYSSLNYLKRFPIDTLKIDRSFITDVTSDPNSAVIASAIIAMAQSLSLKVIAEGVETEEQLDFLRQHGCHAIQGYLYSPPVPPEVIQQLISDIASQPICFKH